MEIQPTLFITFEYKNVTMIVEATSLQIEVRIMSHAMHINISTMVWPEGCLVNIEKAKLII